MIFVGESHMGDVLGGTCSGSAQGVIVLGDGEGIDFLALAVQKRAGKQI